MHWTAYIYHTHCHDGRCFAPFFNGLLGAGRYTPLETSRIKIEYLAEADLDIQVFQQLPLYVRHRVLKEGQVVFSRDDDALYELAYRTARAFERFKPIYHTYLDEVAGARS